MKDDLIAIADQNGRYAWEAFEFVMEALSHSQRMFGKESPHGDATPGPEHHVTGRELLEGVCDLARREFGLMAPVVFEQWGVRRTDDIGEIVFTLISAQVLSKTDSDRLEDFQNVFDLERALTEGYRILDGAQSRWSP
jgi:uncharacterized repeat protein (TIGR04138 family)